MILKLFVTVILFTALCSTTGLLSTVTNSWAGCVSHHEIKPILKSEFPNVLISSIDLGFSQCEVVLNSDGLSQNGHLLATWGEMQKIATTENSCFALYNDGSKPWQISTLSKNTGYPASLCPPLDKSGPPTLVLGGFTMHRISGEKINPMVDTDAKVATIRSALLDSKNVLDTCMGLGYTAIEAAKCVRSGGTVTTIEHDEASLEMCTYNPWSAKLFDNTLPINIIQVEDLFALCRCKHSLVIRNFLFCPIKI